MSSSHGGVLRFSAQDSAFRHEVRAFLAESFTPELRRMAARQASVFAEGELCRRWHRILFEKGWVAPAWPVEYGGPGWSPTQRYIFAEECAEAGTPSLPAFGLQMVGPVFMRYGTVEQKSHFLPRILSGEDYWCQGFSEPQAGSDLASVQCRAERDGEEYVVQGTKIWTTYAQFANWIFMLVRTAAGGKPQEGISFLLVPMNLPGVTVRPIISSSGEHEVNQVFFDNVRVPVANRLGAENQGWTVAKCLLEFERGGSYAPRIKRLLRQVRMIAASEEDGDGRPFAEDPLFQAALAEIEIDLLAIDIMERRQVASTSAGQAVGGTAASILKVQGTELWQRVTELAVQALGPRALPDYYRRRHEFDSPAIGPEYAQTPVARYLNARASTIYGGASEIQRNILAKVWLGL